MSQLDELLGQIPMSQLAQQVGASEDEVAQATQSVLPALLGGLQSNANDPQGAQSLLQALGQHENSLFDGPLDLGQVDPADGEKIVGHVFGGNQEQVINQLGGLGGGMSSGLIGKLLPILAPIVLSFLAKKLGGQLPGGLGGMLGGGQEPQAAPAGPAAPGQAAQQDPTGGLGDLLGSILGGAAPGGQTGQAGGGLGDILGQVLGGRKG